MFENMPDRNLASWNSILSGFSEIKFYRESLNVFSEMLMGEDRMISDNVTLVTVLPVFAGEGEVEMGLAAKSGVSEELMVNNALVDMYSKCFCYEWW